MELRAALAFPAGVLGPLDLAPLARAAAIWAAVRGLGAVFEAVPAGGAAAGIEAGAAVSGFWVRLSIAWAIVGCRGRKTNFGRSVPRM